MRPVAYAFLAYLAACLEPTEVNLILSTDICELRHVNVFLGDGTEPVATLDRQASLKCDGTLGNLVFIPSKRPGGFQVRVEGTIRADNVCGPAGCVRVSRSVGFVQHSRLQLPVVIERSCLDVMCPKGKTCRQGVCIDDTVDCRIDNTCVETDGGIEGGAMDSGADSGSSCPAPGSRIAMGTELYHWSFEDSDLASTVDSKQNIKIQLPMGFKRTPTARCGNALVLGGQQDLSTVVKSPGIALSFELLVPSSTIFPAVLFNAGGTQSSWSVTLLGPPIHIQVAMGTNIAVVQTPTQSTMIPNVWHHIELYVSTQPTVEVAIDMTPIEMVPAASGMKAPPNLTMSVVGSIGGNPTAMQIDELGIFSGL